MVWGCIERPAGRAVRRVFVCTEEQAAWGGIAFACVCTEQQPAGGLWLVCIEQQPAGGLWLVCIEQQPARWACMYACTEWQAGS